MKSLEEIKNILTVQKNRLFEKYPIKSMAIFGSFSTNQQNDSSDLDILVEFNDKIGIQFINLANELESFIGIKVDLVSKKGLKEKYLQAIESDLIYV